MYKLFLCLRYLRSKVFAYFAVLGVALCVWMMLVAVSVMTGFLHKIETAAKGLFGDIVMEAVGERGIAWYDEFIERMKADVPEVDEAGPFILSLGMLRVEDDKDFRRYVEIAGIRLPDRAAETDFEDGLFVQGGSTSPTWDPPIDELIAADHRQQDEMRAILEREFPTQLAALTDEQRDMVLKQWVGLEAFLDKGPVTPDQRLLLRRISNAGLLQADALRTLRRAKMLWPRRMELQAKLDAARKGNASATEIDDLATALDDLDENIGFEPADRRVILGLGIPGLSFRTSEGETVRYLVPGHRVILYVAPLGKEFTKFIEPNIRRFSIVDDSRTDVSSIDKKLVYVPFDTLQQLNNMAPEVDEHGQLDRPARCSQIHIKVKGSPNERQLREIASKIRAVWQEFAKGYEDRPARQRPVVNDIGIETWRQRQSQVVGPIERQRTLVGIIMAIMSLVAVALIFVILYTIVVQKTREIGVLKAVGASGWGVAGLFFAYGAVIGLVGSLIGVVAGIVTVDNINHIQDWADSTFGFRVWSKETFMFEKIPSEVDWTIAAVIVGGSILAGLVGALVPAIRAARMQPVEALRYE